MDTVELNKKFVAKNNYNFVLLSDPSKEYAKHIGVLSDNGAYAKRWTYYIDPHGVVKYIDKRVSVRSHGGDVAKRMEELGVPKK